MTDQQPNPSEDEVYASCRMLLLQRVQQEDHEALKEALTICVGLLGASRAETLVLQEICPYIKDPVLGIWVLGHLALLVKPAQ
uniref:Uncharacterized protein n=1 Tax=Cyanothece sp. (strain PCC 7425 / ATCC 29141) TaxID=395961 RepID=B8HWH4_CYAP4